MKPYFTKDHAEVISAVWENLDDEARNSMYVAVATVLGITPDKPAGDLPYREVVRISWSIGFHFAMIAMEQGALIKVGDPQQN